MSIDDLAIGISILWGAVSLPLAWLNPLKFSDDELARKILVYIVAPFIFFSVVFFVIGAVRRTRGQKRDSLRAKLNDTFRNLDVYAQNDEDGNKEFKAFVEGILEKAGQAIKRGKHKVAEELLLDANNFVQIRRLVGPERPIEPGRYISKGVDGII